VRQAYLPATRAGAKTELERSREVVRVDTRLDLLASTMMRAKVTNDRAQDLRMLRSALVTATLPAGTDTFAAAPFCHTSVNDHFAI
jgi:hypothetical protein